MPTYFEDFETVEEIKKEYRRLAMLNHPDRGGNTAVMQEINNQYQAALAACNEQESVGTDGKTHKYYYNAEAEAAVMEALSNILKIKMNSNVTIALVGQWLWMQGDTKPYKEELAAVGCIWSYQRQAWYWRTEGKKRRYNSNADLSMLAAKYGYTMFKPGDDDPDAKNKRKGKSKAKARPKTNGRPTRPPTTGPARLPVF